MGGRVCTTVIVKTKGLQPEKRKTERFHATLSVVHVGRYRHAAFLRFISVNNRNSLHLHPRPNVPGSSQ
jgi:hypothetical protein